MANYMNPALAAVGFGDPQPPEWTPRRKLHEIQVEVERQFVKTRVLQDARFWWITGIALFSALGAYVVHNIDWASKCTLDVLTNCSPTGLTEGQQDNVQYACQILGIGSVAAWFFAAIYLWFQRPAIADSIDDDVFSDLWAECRAMTTYSLQRGIALEPADLKYIDDTRSLIVAVHPAPPRQQIPAHGRVNRRERRQKLAAERQRAYAHNRKNVEALREERVRAVPDLTDIHQRLAVAVEPAMPNTLRLLHEPIPNMSSATKRAFPWLGNIRLVRMMVGLIIVLIPGFIGLAINVGRTLVNPDDLFGGTPMDQFLSSSYLLVASALGAAFAGLFKAFRYIGNVTYDEKYESTYWVRFTLGVVAGVLLSVVLSELIFGNTSDDSTGFRLTLPLLALVGGFSSDLVYRILNRVVDALATLVEGSTDERVELEKLQADARLKKHDMAKQNETVRELLRIRAFVSDDPDAQRQIDAYLHRYTGRSNVARTVEIALSAADPAGDEPLQTVMGAPVDVELEVKPAAEAFRVLGAVVPESFGELHRRPDHPATWQFQDHGIVGDGHLLFWVGAHQMQKPVTVVAAPVAATTGPDHAADDKP